MTGPDRALRLDEARARIDAAIVPLHETEQVRLVDALGRVLACDLVSTVAVPAHDNAAMDGYALRANPRAPRTLTVVGAAFAGHPFAGRVGPDECVRIMTGAVIPADCDAVVAQEDVVARDGSVTLDAAVPAGRHRRLAGEDLTDGAVALARGRRIGPAELAVAASIGVGVLDVVRRVRVAVFSTGDELRDVGDPLEVGGVRDANRYAVIGMVAALGAEPVDLGIVRDDPAALAAALDRACGDVRADAIVTSGGVSAGDADHTRKALSDVAFWSLAVKPGRPMAFGRVARGGRHAWLFALPGNPVATIVVFQALVRDALLKLMGASPDPLLTIVAASDVAIAKAPGRTEFVRGRVFRDDAGWRVRPTGSQGSGVLRSISEANGLVVLAHDRGPVAAGEAVEVWPLRGGL